MHVVLSILEILGWSLLVLFLLLIVILLLLLFCRFRYVAEGEFLDEKWARFKVRWLFRLIRAKISYGDDLIYGEVHIFWKKITFSYDLTKKEKYEEENFKKTEDGFEGVLSETVEEEFEESSSETVEEEFEESSSETVEEEFKGSLNETDNEFDEVVFATETTESEEQRRVEEKVIGTETSSELRGETEPWSKNKDSEGSSQETTSGEGVVDGENDSNNEHSESIISKIKGKIKRIKQVYLKVKKMLTDEKNKKAVKHLKTEVIYFIKMLLPKKTKIDAVFSTGSPDTTGQLFGVLACFPAMYRKNWKLIPDFQADEAYFRGTFSGKGWFAFYQIVGIALRIIFDKNCRRLYTMVNKFLKWFKKDDKSQEEK